MGDVESVDGDGYRPAHRVSSVDGTAIQVVVREEEETLPDIHEGDILTVDPERVAAWLFMRTEDSPSVNEQDAYLLAKEGASE